MATEKKRRSSALLPSQEIFVDAVMTGASQAEAGRLAGVQNGAGIARSEKVQAEIAAAREELINLTTIKRVDVIDGILDGIQVARMQGDGGNMIRGWVEISKVLGLSAPEVKKIVLTTTQQRLRSKFEELSDEDLLAIAEGRVIEGEASVPE
jgi:hypothetical protein